MNALAVEPVKGVARANLAPVRLRRTMDPAPLNAVANDPDVRPWLQGEGPVDLAAAISSPANIALVTDGGGFFLEQLTAGEFEVHSMFLPSARHGTVEAMRQGMEYMFTRTGCVRIVTKVPDGNKRAASLAAAGGFKRLFHREKAWGEVGAEHLAIDLDTWAMNNPALEAHGEWFHETLEAGKKAAGSELPTHDHDPAHERAVGAAVLMLRSGNIHKAVAFYNRWAVFAGYRPLALLTETPTVLDVGDALVELRDGGMEILQCR